MTPDITKLRISIARVAQAAGVSLSRFNIPDDAEYSAIHAAALLRERGWNALCAEIIDKVYEVAATRARTEGTVARLEQEVGLLRGEVEALARSGDTLKALFEHIDPCAGSGPHPL